MYLQKIIDYKKLELESLKRKVSIKDVRSRSSDVEPAKDFLEAMRPGACSVRHAVVAGSSRPEIRIIAEVKKASPSAGMIRPDFDPVKIAQSYEENGAAALSVLTDEHFFQGSLRYLENIRKRIKLPLLRKDFTFDEYQIYEARGAGADAILLIASILEDSQMKDYRDLAGELGMSSLVEVHDSTELERAAKIKAELIGINNRDLKTLKVKLETSIELAPRAPREATLVSESGISTADDIKRLCDAGIHAFLIGESLIKLTHPGEGLAGLQAFASEDWRKV